MMYLNRIISKLKKGGRAFFNSGYRKKKLLINTVSLFVILTLFKKMLPFKKFKRFYTSLLKSNYLALAGRYELDEYIQSIHEVSKMWNPRCLVQALTLKYFCRKDKEVKVIVGIQFKFGFESHAWVEVTDKIVLGDLPDQEFKKIWEWK